MWAKVEKKKAAALEDEADLLEGDFPMFAFNIEFFLCFDVMRI